MKKTAGLLTRALSSTTIFIMAIATKVKEGRHIIPPLVSPKERLLVWEHARGMWQHRMQEPIQELTRIRKGWNRRIQKIGAK